MTKYLYRIDANSDKYNYINEFVNKIVGYFIVCLFNMRFFQSSPNVILSIFMRVVVTYVA